MIAGALLALATALPSPCPADRDVSIVAARVKTPATSNGSPVPPERVIVYATVGPDGRLTAATLYSSTGYRDLDRAAIDAIRRSAFIPRISACRGVAVRQTYLVDFSKSPPVVRAVPTPVPIATP